VEETADPELLVERARKGDVDAWEVLYRRAYPQLLAYARRRLDPEGARDAVSETMARAVSRLQGFRWNGGGFDAWLFGILRHVVIDAQRANNHHKSALVSPEPAQTPVDAEDPGPGPLDHVLGRERAASVRAAFDQLSAFDREVLELRVVAGLSSDEVAVVVGKRPGAVRMAQARALDRLRALLDEEP
jgi:RNA polymerase sigma-70 factor, ECF subfamily